MGSKLKPMTLKDYKNIFREAPIHFAALGLLSYAGLILLDGMPPLLAGIQATLTDSTTAVHWGSLSIPFLSGGILALTGGGLYVLAARCGWIKHSLKYLKKSGLKNPPSVSPWPLLIFGIILGFSSMHLLFMQLRIPNYPYPLNSSYYSLCFFLAGTYIGLGIRLLRQKKRSAKQSRIKPGQVKWTLKRLFLILFGGGLIFLGFPTVLLDLSIFPEVFPGSPDRFLSYVFYGVIMLAAGIVMTKKARKPSKNKIMEPEQSEEALIEREEINHLTKEVERYQQRNKKLEQILANERAEKSKLEERIHQLQGQVNELNQREMVQYQRDPRDIRKIHSLKGLVRELRAEVERLSDLNPKPQERTMIEKDKPKQQVEENLEPDLSLLRGKTVAVFGRLGKAKEVEGIRLIYHDGNRVDLPMARAAREAAVLVVLTRLVSHGVMWRLKEYAADRGKEIRFVRETGIQRILEKIAQPPDS
ncbi:hypothetical protein C8P63_1561 [Melghirimyces profundicolus]|uniref:Uncharacterized protein n=1 Tax=Melghirimyces profundicolus TaxID=1242148 RepID=A0A2T6ASZ4_9BACL|nr:hypothetical protein [Melghirimyces profundicolus]PTX46856.1 hypothetical protein C8P63_1561 [Melghirimyces profundicolus]